MVIGVTVAMGSTVVAVIGEHILPIVLWSMSAPLFFLATHRGWKRAAKHFDEIRRIIAQGGLRVEGSQVVVGHGEDREDVEVPGSERLANLLPRYAYEKEELWDRWTSERWFWVGMVIGLTVTASLAVTLVAAIGHDILPIVLWTMSTPVFVIATYRGWSRDAEHLQDIRLIGELLHANKLWKSKGITVEDAENAEDNGKPL
jgi:hypothetical protein